VFETFGIPSRRRGRVGQVTPHGRDPRDTAIEAAHERVRMIEVEVEALQESARDLESLPDGGLSA